MKLLTVLAVAALALPLAATPAAGASHGAPTALAAAGDPGYLNLHQCAYTGSPARHFNNFMPFTQLPAISAGTNASADADTALSCGAGGNGWRLDAGSSGFKALDLKAGRYLNLHQCVYRNAAGEAITSVLPDVSSAAVRAATNVSDTMDTEPSCGPGNIGGFSFDGASSSVSAFDLGAGKFLNLHQCHYLKPTAPGTGINYTNLQPNTADTRFNTGTNVSDNQDTAPACGAGGDGWNLDARFTRTLAVPLPRRRMCVDVGSATPADRDLVTIRGCANRDSQRLVVEDGQIKVQSTLATADPKCVDVRSRETGQQAHIWTCRAPGVNPNQHFRIQNGQIKVADTLTTAQPMCLDFGTAFNEGDPVVIRPCAADGSQNPGQDTTVQTGNIIARATM
ncbi:RICIN domain-containing protein [Streptomyces sp. NPDC051180]|uniref:RICIN domain-containing protein n=1 Tax=unclassified Streptomyces TaxID=2593676 RepID=UPI00344F64F5